MSAFQPKLTTVKLSLPTWMSSRFRALAKWPAYVYYTPSTYIFVLATTSGPPLLVSHVTSISKIYQVLGIGRVSIVTEGRCSAVARGRSRSGAEYSGHVQRVTCYQACIFIHGNSPWWRYATMSWLQCQDCQCHMSRVIWHSYLTQNLIAVYLKTCLSYISRIFCTDKCATDICTGCVNHRAAIFGLFVILTVHPYKWWYQSYSFRT